MLARAVWGITRSCSFLGLFVAIYQSEPGAHKLEPS
jgi:hypothetical protein